MFTVITPSWRGSYRSLRRAILDAPRGTPILCGGRPVKWSAIPDGNGGAMLYARWTA